MPQTIIDTILGTVILNESHRAKRVSIKISERKGAITLTYPFGFDKQKAIAFLEEKREKVLEIKERQQKKTSAVTNPPAASYDEDKLWAAAMDFLPKRIAKIASETNLKYNKVSVRATRTRWGSCSSENNISLSIYLMTLPEYLIDFIIIHELCHTIHHNHSPKFHELVNFICNGREKEFEQDLRKFQIR